MKKYCLLLSFVLAALLPNILFALFIPERTELEEPDSSISYKNTTVIKVYDGEEIQNMELETYVASVLLGEMPSSFEMEAKKAQAVAIRTYTLKRFLSNSMHTGFHLCTDASCCQAFRELDDSTAAVQALEATKLTASEVLMYGSELIDATYFSCSGGMTEAALEVWGSDVPYLQSVLSPGEEEAAHYQDTVIYTTQEFFSRLGLSVVRDVPKITYTEGGGIKTLSIGNQSFTGQQLRNALNLRSTSAEFAFNEDSVEITTKGYGHRVGLSQYGANAMATNGSSYKQILAYYYSGVNLAQFDTLQQKGMFDKDHIL